MRHGFHLLLSILLPLLITGFNSFSSKEKTPEELLPNILFIPVDDLRPTVGCLGADYQSV